MAKHEVSTPEQLDVALSASALRKRAALWKAAEGHSYRWTDAAGLLSGGVLFALGFAREISPDADGGVGLALGVLMIVSFIGGYVQRQLSALAELLKGLEQERSSSRAR